MASRGGGHLSRQSHVTKKPSLSNKDTRTPSPRRSRRGSVTFDQQTSIFPEDSEGVEQQGLLKGAKEEEEVEQRPARGSCYGCHFLVENKIARRLFRVCAVVNLISLVFSAPLKSCNPGEPNNTCNDVFVQLVIITILDSLLALLYTIQMYVRSQYCLYQYLKKKQFPSANDQETKFEVDGTPKKNLSGYTSGLRLLTLLMITVSLWYSVGIGIYRTYTHYIRVEADQDPSIGWYFYFPFIIRSLATGTAMKLFVHLKIPPEAFQGLIKKIKWKQLISVTLFYFFFVYIYALVGVQWIGGLPSACVPQENTQSLGIPVTHCNSNSSSDNQGSCFADESMICTDTPSDAYPLNFNYRDRVYLGQFRTILDALFAVYEASSLELWFFMDQAAMSGATRSDAYIVVFYITLVFFLVFLFQQSIFLVVIIESFAGLRGDSALDSSKEDKKKPVIVLEHHDNSLHLQSLKNHESTTTFEKRLNKYYFLWIERIFLVLVLLDAVFTAVKHTGMSDELSLALRCWQPTVSAMFLIEITGVLVVHLFYNQLKLFYSNSYYWYLAVIAVCGMVASIPVYHLYFPQTVGNGFAIFQALRLPRAIRLIPPLKRFLFKILGGGLKLLVVFLIVAVFLVWFAAISMQIFGYLDTEVPCNRIGTDQFRDFFKALESMFQLIMQEGWTELMGEIMCHRDGVWWLMNIYFIVLHLFGSLVLLNFFVAVILDNLDYDDQKKKEKFEKEFKERKVEKVSWKSKVFQCCGPKRIRVPKLSSADAPDLSEADVRKFYNTGDASDFPVTFDVPDQPLINSQQNQPSELSGLELLTEDDATASKASHQNKYWRVQGILNYVKAFRQHNRETEATARPTFDILRGKTNTQTGLGIGQFESSNVRNEYDEYLEKYRLFDTALFCMPPDHWLRRSCNKILTGQLNAPSNGHTTESQDLRIIFVMRLKFIIQYIVSLFPYFTWLMLFITLGTIAVQFHELDVNIQNVNPTFIWLSDLVFIVATLIELVLKILARGLFFNPNAAISHVWDVLDWIILMATFAVTVVYLHECPPSPLKIDITFVGLSTWFEFLLFFRQIRPLRLISLIPSMRQVLDDVLLGWRKFLQAAILLAGFIFMFASLGVQLFAGTDSPQSFCNDPAMKTIEDCVGEYDICIEISPQELLPSGENDVSIRVSRVWYESRRDFKFDHIGLALLTLFEVLTLEGWLDVRDVFSDKSELYMKFYLHIFVFLGVNLGLQLFVGIVVNNFNEHKPDHSALLTVSQKRWQDLTQRISLTRPIKQPPEPRNNRVRSFFYKLFVHPYYKYISSVIIALNSALLFVPWDDRDEVLKDVDVYLIGFFIVFAVFYFIEFLLKLVAFGLSYFQSRRNMFDCLLSVLALVYITLAIVYLSMTMIDIKYVADMALVLSVLKIITILMKYSTFQNLLSTVGNTLFKTAPLFGALMSIILAYAFALNLFFNNVRSGEAIDYGLVNFSGVFVSIIMVFRVMTGEDWHQLLTDAMVGEPYCSQKRDNCGNNALAIILFISYYIVVTFILVNVFVAVLLENFSIFYNEDDTELSHGVVKDFKQNWLHFDKKASATITNNKVKLFLRTLRLQDFFTYHINENGVKERKQFKSLTDPLILREIAEELRRDPRQLVGRPDQALTQQQFSLDTNRETHSFQDVLKTVGYRAEDITKRLVPHELYVREELEESVQFDVAENCILTWMQCFVKPVVKSQDRQRRPTMSHSVLRRTPNLGLREDSVMWDLPDGGWNEHYISAPDTEDEGEVNNSLSYGKQLQQATSHQLPKSEEDLASPALAKSYAKLEKATPRGCKPATKDKWHDWFQLQADWMKNVEKNPEHYFDDYL